VVIVSVVLVFSITNNGAEKHLLLLLQQQKKKKIVWILYLKIQNIQCYLKNCTKEKINFKLFLKKYIIS
jgi:hypothetical protein